MLHSYIDQETSKNDEAKTRYRAVKIQQSGLQRQENKQTNKQHSYIPYVRTKSRK
jgi:hypothetical protein